MIDFEIFGWVAPRHRRNFVVIGAREIVSETTTLVWLSLADENTSAMMHFCVFLPLLVVISSGAPAPVPLDSARLLFFPLTKAAIADLLTSLPTQFTSQSKAILEEPFDTDTQQAIPSDTDVLRVDLRLHMATRRRSSPPVKYTTQGDFLIVEDTLVRLPLRADTFTQPIVMSSHAGQVSVAVHTLTARARTELSKCNSSPECLRKVTASLCSRPVSPYLSPHRMVSAAMRCAHGGQNGEEYLHAAGMFVTKMMSSLYQGLVVLLVIAQIGAFIWGTAFTLIFLPSELCATVQSYFLRYSKLVWDYISRAVKR